MIVLMIQFIILIAKNDFLCHFQGKFKGGSVHLLNKKKRKSKSILLPVVQINSKMDRPRGMSLYFQHINLNFYMSFEFLKNEKKRFLPFSPLVSVSCRCQAYYYSESVRLFVSVSPAYYTQEHREQNGNLPGINARLTVTKSQSLQAIGRQKVQGDIVTDNINSNENWFYNI